MVASLADLSLSALLPPLWLVTVLMMLTVVLIAWATGGLFADVARTGINTTSHPAMPELVVH